MQTATLSEVREILAVAEETKLPLGQLKKLLELVGHRGFCPEQFQDLLGSPLLPDFLTAAKDGKLGVVDRTIFRHVLGLSSVEEGRDATPPVSHIVATYRFKVLRSQPLTAQIAAGKYDWENPDINNQHFPQVGGVDEPAEGALFHFGRPMTSEEVITKMAEEGYEPEELPALLALGAAQPDLQRQYPIIALASVWVYPFGDRRVPCLDGDSGERFLSLSWCDDGWSGGCRFLGRRKRH